MISPGLRRRDALRSPARRGGRDRGVLFPQEAWATRRCTNGVSALGSGAPQPASNDRCTGDRGEGNTVPIVIDVESPMTDANYVKTILVVADGNPLPGVARFDLSPINGRAHVEFDSARADRNITAVA